MKIKRIISLLVLLSFIFTTPMFTISNCSALDMTHDYYEERKLLNNKMVYLTCKDHEDD